MLERLGYAVTMRTSSIEALAAFQNQPDQFDVVIHRSDHAGDDGLRPGKKDVKDTAEHTDYFVHGVQQPR